MIMSICQNIINLKGPYPQKLKVCYTALDTGHCVIGLFFYNEKYFAKNRFLQISWQLCVAEKWLQEKKRGSQNWSQENNKGSQKWLRK